MKTALLTLILFLFPTLINAGKPNQNVTGPVRAVLIEELDQKAIHELYNNGEFETVIDVLERFQKNNPNCSFSDSVFIAKHLAVVYSATPATREKGRFYMMRLLELVPTAKLIDMFVSDEIDRIFERVREEFIAKRRGFGLDTLTVTVPDTRNVGIPNANHGSTNAKTSGWGNSKYWIAGSAAAIALGATAYLYLSRDESGSGTRELVISKPDGSK